jgi:hypothetical protein
MMPTSGMHVLVVAVVPLEGTAFALSGAFRPRRRPNPLPMHFFTVSHVFVALSGLRRFVGV